MNILNKNSSYFLITLVLMLGLLASESSLSQANKVEYNDYGKPVSSTRGEFVVNQSVNLRSRADTNSQVIGVLPAGATVMVDGATHGYYKITYDGKTGYSWHKFFTLKQ